MIFAYFAPEVVLPMASVLVAGFGFIMMVGRAPFRFVARSLRAGLRGRKKTMNKPNA
jgi:hypothetical protein